MISRGKVIKTEGDKAVVRFVRQSACGGNCASCAGCAESEITAEADNSIGAVVGDTVTVESETSKVLKTAFLVYVCPLIAFIAVYFISVKYTGEERAAFISAAVFVLFWFLLGRIDKKKNISVRIMKINNGRGEINE